MKWEELEKGLRVRAIDGAMKGRTGFVEDFGELPTLAGTTRKAVIVRFDEPATSYATKVEFLEEA